MEQLPLFEVLRRRVSMIITVCVISSVGGYAFSFLIPERYAASALVLVRPQQPIKIVSDKATKENLDFPMGSSTSVETPGKTYIEIIKSTELIGKVVRNLGLDQKKEAGRGSISKFMPPYVAVAWAGLIQSFKDLTAILKYGRLIEDDSFTKAVKGVGDGLSLKSREDTYLFEIAYKATDPQVAADVANTTAKLFMDFMEGIRSSEAQYARDQLATQLEQSRRHVDSARQRLQSYKEAHSVFIYDSEYTAKLKVIGDLEVELAKAEAALAGSQNTLSTASLAARRTRLVRSLRDHEAELAPLPRLEHELKQLELEVQNALTAYQVIEKEFQEAELKNSYQTPEIRLVSQAVPPQLPSSPGRFTIATASLFAGLVVAVGLAFFLEYLDRQVRGVRDVEDFVGVKVLGTIPRVAQRRWRQAGLL
jgi:uncharacterized protein involved in exopolysaccharide biosynthesis